jgi:hypothetical protein
MLRIDALVVDMESTTIHTNHWMITFHFTVLPHDTASASSDKRPHLTATSP